MEENFAGNWEQVMLPAVKLEIKVEEEEMFDEDSTTNDFTSSEQTRPIKSCFEDQPEACGSGEMLCDPLGRGAQLQAAAGSESSYILPDQYEAAGQGSGKETWQQCDSSLSQSWACSSPERESAQLSPTGFLTGPSFEGVVPSSKNCPLVCRVCSQPFYRSVGFNSHMRIKLTEEEGEMNNLIFKCKLCPITFSQLFSAHKHVYEFHCINFSCEKCNKPYMSEDDIDNHNVNGCKSSRNRNKAKKTMGTSVKQIKSKIRCNVDSVINETVEYLVKHKNFQVVETVTTTKVPKQKVKAKTKKQKVKPSVEPKVEQKVVTRVDDSDDDLEIVYEQNCSVQPLPQEQSEPPPDIYCDSSLLEEDSSGETNQRKKIIGQIKFHMKSILKSSFIKQKNVVHKIHCASCCIDYIPYDYIKTHLDETSQFKFCDCPFCGKENNDTILDFLTHFNSHICKQNIAMIKCDLCNFSFFNIVNKSIHLVTIHHGR